MKRPQEILDQAITSLGHGFGKPEEIAHKVIFYPDSMAHSLIVKNLQHTALRIEKHGSKYRFLFAGGTSDNTAFKEVITQEFGMQPKYIGLFAIKGFTNARIVPVTIKFFRLTSEPCAE